MEAFLWKWGELCCRWKKKTSHDYTQFDWGKNISANYDSFGWSRLFFQIHNSPSIWNLKR